MVATNAIRNAMKARLEDGGLGMSGAWPNVGYNGAMPYFEVDFAAIDRDSDLDGSFRRETGMFYVNVASAIDVGEGTANNLADAVAVLFAAGVRILVTGAVVAIRATPIIKGGYRAESEWRTPVEIPYVATATP